MEKVAIENYEACAICGGMCCKKCGCDYFVSDFESMKLDYLESKLDDDKCHYSLEDRPRGGSSLIPLEYGMCYSEVDRIEELNKWIPYQKVLHRIVKRRIGMSVYAKLNEDIENVIFDLLAGNTEGCL